MKKDFYQHRHSVRISHYVEYFGWKCASTVLSWMPRRVTVAFADWAGWLLYAVFRARRKVVHENLMRAFGQEKTAKEIKQIELRSYQNAVLTFCEFVQPRCAGKNALSLFTAQHGMEHATAFRERGGVFVTAHIGNWELLGHAFSAMGYKMDAILKPLHNPLIDRDVARRRSAAGFGLIPTTGSLKAIVSSIRSGRHPVFLADQDARRSGIFVNFFGHPASTAVGPAYFAVRMKVPIACGFCVRNNDKERSLSLIVLPPLEPEENAPEEEAIERLTQKHVKLLEDVVRAYPESYFWFHRRWKTKPKKSVHTVTVNPAAESEM